jgi:hypothetical protein
MFYMHKINDYALLRVSGAPATGRTRSFVGLRPLGGLSDVDGAAQTPPRNGRFPPPMTFRIRQFPSIHHGRGRVFLAVGNHHPMCARVPPLHHPATAPASTVPRTRHLPPVHRAFSVAAPIVPARHKQRATCARSGEYVHRAPRPSQ